MRLVGRRGHATTLGRTNDTSYYDAVGANLVLELRLTWRLDRLLYASDEPTLERVRLERRRRPGEKIATRALEVLFRLAAGDLAGAWPWKGSREQIELACARPRPRPPSTCSTGGWFSSRDAP